MKLVFIYTSFYISNIPVESHYPFLLFFLITQEETLLAMGILALNEDGTIIDYTDQATNTDIIKLQNLARKRKRSTADEEYYTSANVRLHKCRAKKINSMRKNKFQMRARHADIDSFNENDFLMMIDNGQYEIKKEYSTYGGPMNKKCNSCGALLFEYEVEEMKYNKCCQGAKVQLEGIYIHQIFGFILKNIFVTLLFLFIYRL